MTIAGTVFIISFYYNYEMALIMIILSYVLIFFGTAIFLYSLLFDILKATLTKRTSTIWYFPLMLIIIASITYGWKTFVKTHKENELKNNFAFTKGMVTKKLDKVSKDKKQKVLIEYRIQNTIYLQEGLCINCNQYDSVSIRYSISNPRIIQIEN